MFSKESAPTGIPRYCPNCSAVFRGDHDSPLCSYCGDSLVPQAYCAVCEDWWRLPVDALCPKHEIALDEAPDADLAKQIPFDQQISWVTVKVFPDSLSAAVPRSRLEAEGIPTFVEGERMGSPAMYRVATGGAKLQVPADRADDARIILSQRWSLPGDEHDDFEDLL